MEAWEVAAREGIRDLVARYNSYGDAGRIDAQLGLFASDASLEVEDLRVYRGIEAIRSLLSGAKGDAAAGRDSKDGGAPVSIRHHVSTHQIDVSSRDQATGRCYFSVYTPSGVDHWGRYVDAYREIDGHWRFTSRVVTVEGQVTGGWAERTSARLAASR